ncbi:hypothetical protein TrVGV298_010289 [Trichoderma virens]|nr:hypothetical protein TrVGV298_010289 [Trichoderma virens]
MTEQRRPCSFLLLLAIGSAQNILMALMIASAALSGVGIFVYTHSSKLHDACTRLLSEYEVRESDDGISRKRRRVGHPEDPSGSDQPSPNPTQRYLEAPEPGTQPSPNTQVERYSGAPERPSQPLPNIAGVPRTTQQPPRTTTYTLGREPDTEVDNTSAVYKNKEILADVAQYIDREDSNYKIARFVSANNDDEEDSDFLDYLEMEASGLGTSRPRSANTSQQVAAAIDAYLAMDDSDQVMEPTGPANNSQEVASDLAAYIAMDDSDQVMEPTASSSNSQHVMSDIAAYIAKDDSDQDMEPIASGSNNQQVMSDIAAYIAKDDSIGSGDKSALTVRFVEPKKEDDDIWSKPLVYNKAQPGPSPSVSSIGDIFEELGISPLDLNDRFEDDEPKIIWFDDEDELNELARGLAQRYRSVRAGKQPAVAEPAPKADPTGRIEEILALPSVETLKISDESKAEVESMQAKAAETRLVDQQREKFNRERLLREQALQKLKERTSKGPRLPMVAPLSDEWIDKIAHTIELPEAEVVAKTCQGIPLRRHDFASVVAAKTWLNDEIVNGALAELEKQINLVAGITDYKQQGRKCLVMNSFFWPRVKEAGGKKTQSILRRMGVTPKNFLLMDTVLVPICQDYHWTLLVVQPKDRKVMHLDSFNRRSSHPDLALAWMSDYLGDLYHARPWQVMVMKTPQQTNGYDCGVHVITNGVCLALGLDPLKSYNVEEMALQRLRIAGMLLNGGFEGEFDLWQQ